MQPVGVLGRVDPLEHRELVEARAAAAAARCRPVQAGSAFSSSTTASTSAWVAVAGRSRRMLAMPTSAQSRCLAATYQRLPGSSPTSTVPRPGHDARVAQRGDPRRQLDLDRRQRSPCRRGSCATAHPARLHAVASTRRSVGEVPGAGEVHRQPGRRRRPRSPRGRAPSRPAARPRARRRRSAPAARPGTGRTRRRRRPSRPPGRRPATPPAGHESTRLTWPMPMPTEAPPAASRIAFDFTARTARQAKARSASVAGVGRPARRPASSRPGRRPARRPGRPTAPAARPRSAAARAGRRSGARATQHPQVLLLGPDLEHARRRRPGAMTTSVKIVGASARPARRVTGRLAATTPPYALTGSQACALPVGLGDVGADRDAARVGVLDDRDARLVEVVGRPPGRVRVDVVVVAHRLAGSCSAWASPGPPRPCATYSAARWCGFSP